MALQFDVHLLVEFEFLQWIVIKAELHFAIQVGYVNEILLWSKCRVQVWDLSLGWRLWTESDVEILCLLPAEQL